MAGKVKNVIKRFVLCSFAVSLCVFVLNLEEGGSIKVFAATHQEAETDGYDWISNYPDGKHHMMNMPITDWKSSAPKGSLMYGEEGKDYLLQEGAGMGGFVNRPVTFKWSDMNRLTMTNSNVWMTKYIDGKPYDYTQYGSGLQNNLSFYRYDGTFYIDPEYDMSGMKFSVIPISESPYAYINVDMYVFMYPMCLKPKINDSNFMNTFVMWSGTQTWWPDSSYFHGVEGQPVYDYVSNPPLVNGQTDKFADWRIYTNMIDANASNAVAYGWNQVKNSSDYDGRWGITIMYGANGEGYSYRFLVGAEFNPNQILYNGNGATSGANKMQKQNYNTTVYLSNNWFARDGYVFTGWNDRADGSGTSYKPGDAYSSPRPLKLFAQWKRAEYTVTFHGNGNTGGSTPQQTLSVGVQSPLAANGFTKTGYHFTGWATAADKPAVYSDKQQVLNLSTTNGGNVNLYATWGANQYTIHFDTNGGTGSMPDFTLTYDRPANLPINAFTRINNYGPSTFKGWNTTNSTKDILYTDGQEVLNLTSEKDKTLTFYAIWDDCPGIEAEDRYFTTTEADAGIITEEELFRTASAADLEDGDISPGENFVLIDFYPDEYIGLECNADFRIKYKVTDSIGNTYVETVYIHVVNDKPEDIGGPNPDPDNGGPEDGPGSGPGGSGPDEGDENGGGNPLTGIPVM